MEKKNWFIAGKWGVSHGAITLGVLAGVAGMVHYLAAPKALLLVAQAGAMLHWWKRESLDGRRSYRMWSTDSKFDFWVPTIAGLAAVIGLWTIL